jgi:hypothetical protein
MTNSLPEIVSSGVLLPATFLQSGFFVILSAFVAINTIVYFVLAVAKILPRVYISDWISGANRRSETRSIFPNSPITAAVIARGRGNQPVVHGDDSGGGGTGGLSAAEEIDL